MKTLRRKIGSVVKVAVGLGAVFCTTSAVADSTVTYSGYECLYAEKDGNQGGFLRGAAFSGTYTRCPLTRINSDDTTEIKQVYIRVYDASSTGSVTCQAHSCDGFGATCSPSSQKTTDASFVGETYLVLGSMAAHENGYAYIHCSFPAGPGGSKPRIFSYRATD